jgi:flagellar biogenesis protein FliO
MAMGKWRFSQSSMAEQLAALWARMRRVGSRNAKRLRLCESLALGERRFVAVVEFENERFLLGGTASSLVLLARLAGSREEQLQDTVQTGLNALWSGGTASVPRGERC